MTLRVLYLGMMWDYGDPSRGTGFEENSFHAGLRSHPDVDVVHFDYVDKERVLGREAMNRELIDVAKEGFDALFCVTFKDTITAESLAAVSETGATTIGWGCDDHWRFDDFSSVVAPAYDYWVTTARSVVPRFEALGLTDRIIKSQWAVEPSVYYPLDVERDIDVSFVGQPHGCRREIIDGLRTVGIEVAVYGRGWDGPQTRITHDEMLTVFSRSKLDLNLSNSSVMGEQQIKGRVFEVPGCRGLLLTDEADDLEQYYVDGREIVVYRSQEDLRDKIAYYLEHDEEREAIASAGYERTMSEHTWKHRFDEIFTRAGLG